VSQYQKGKTKLDFTEARDSEWQWYQLGHMQICTLLQTDNHASTPALKANASYKNIFLHSLRVSTFNICQCCHLVTAGTSPIHFVTADWVHLMNACIVVTIT